MAIPRPRPSRVAGVLATVGAAIIVAVAASANADSAEAGPVPTPDHPTLSSLSVSPHVVAVGSTTSGTISRRTGNSTSIRLQSSNPNVVSVPTAISVRRGPATRTFEVKTLGAVGGCATITATDGDNSLTRNVYAYPRPALRAPFRLNISPTAGTEPPEYTPVFHGLALTGTVSRSSRTAGGNTIYLSSNTPMVSVPRSVTFRIGSSSTSFRVVVSGRPDCAVITASDGRSTVRRLLLFVDVPA